MEEFNIPINTVIGNYTITKFLGKGSYGETYAATTSDLSEVAIKFLKSNSEAGGKERFENEAWALKQLDHPNLPKWLGEGTYEERPFIVMSLARGQALGALLKNQILEGGAMGEQKVLSILKDILSALNYLHDLNIVHRDIKPDNVIVRESATSSIVIDLGFCKGVSQPSLGVTFFNAGASRYSPPEKLKHPGRVSPKDDVFAVGVIAYQLLTNRFPWSVSAEADVGHLISHMTTTLPPAVNTINSMVSSEVSEWVMGLLKIDEEQRPSSKAATDAASSLSGANMPRLSSSSSSHLLATRVIRDALHGDIRLTEFEWSVMGSREFQRLRYIKQLGLANLVYPSAEHTRFGHSLGALHVTEKILRSVELSSGQHIALEDRLLARAYALVHDVTHVPFGHTIEDELGIFDRHDENHGRKTRLFFSSHSEIGNILRSTEYGKIILEHFEKDENTVQRKLHLQEFIDSAFGSDVVDYIDRDAYFCGLDHRVDSSIFRRYSLISAPNAESSSEHLGMRLYGSRGIRLDAQYAIERILLERYSLFMKVYAHTMKFSAGAMLGKALYHAIGQGKTQLKQEELESMADHELLLRLRDARHSTTNTLAKRILTRSLYKPVYIGRILTDANLRIGRVSEMQDGFGRERGFSTPQGREEFERNIARKCGVNEIDVIVFFPPSPPGIKKVETWIEDGPGRVSKSDYVTDAEYGRLLERHLALWKIYLFVSPDVDRKTRQRLANEAELMIGRPNELSLGQKIGLDLS